MLYLYVHVFCFYFKFLLRKWRPIRDQIFVVVETVFFHRYHLDTCRPEFYYKCDWNGARIIVKTINDLSEKKNNNNVGYEDFATFATRRFSTLTTIFGRGGFRGGGGVGLGPGGAWPPLKFLALIFYYSLIIIICNSFAKPLF